jgi:hypothetical protein
MRFLASDLSLSNTDPVSSWAASEGDFSLQQASASAQPVFLTSGINSGKSVHIGGTGNDYFNLRNAADDADATITLPADNTNFFMVCQFQSFPLAVIVRHMTIAQRIYQNTGGVTSQLRFHTSSGYNYASNVFAASTDLWWECRQYDDGGTSRIGCIYQEDGGSVVTATPTTNTGDLNWDRLGYGAYWSTPNFYLAEILGFTTALSAGDLTIVQNYLAAQYLP